MNQWINESVNINDLFGCTFDLPRVWLVGAQVQVRSVGLISKQEWLDWRRDGLCPDNIPSDPAFVYRDDKGWLSWADFLGFGEGQVGQ